MTAHSAESPCNYKTACSLCYNNLVSQRLNTVFMLTPKVASQSIVTLYRNNVSAITPFMSTQFVAERCDNYLKVATVRNPWERLVSCWKDKTINQYHRTWPMYGFKPGQDFKSFAEAVIDISPDRADKHFREQSSSLMWGGVEVFDILIRLESIADDWKAATDLIFEHSGNRLPSLPHIHASGHEPYQAYYTDKLAERVGEYYHNDIALFRYRFE